MVSSFLFSIWYMTLARCIGVLSAFRETKKSVSLPMLQSPWEFDRSSPVWPECSCTALRYDDRSYRPRLGAFARRILPRAFLTSFKKNVRFPFDIAHESRLLMCWTSWESWSDGPANRSFHFQNCYIGEVRAANIFIKIGQNIKSREKKSLYVLQ